MTTLYLSGRNEFTTVTVDLTTDGAEVVGYGEAGDAFFALAFTDTERLLLAAALLRQGEHVERLTEDVSEMKRTKEQGGSDE